MKKTLIAMAVLAASGASFAQATISGNLTMGYVAVTAGGTTAAPGSVNTSGFGVDTSQVDFAASEDLGGGWKAGAKMSLAGADRSGESGNGNVTGRDASLSLTTPVGVLTLGAGRSADYLSGGLAAVGSFYNGWDGKVFSDRTTRDTVTFTVPVGDWSLAGTYQEAAFNASNVNAQPALGLGAGTTGVNTSTGQTLAGAVIGYKSGALAANFTYLQFNSPVGGFKNQSRLSGNYDFGVAQVGAGMVVTSLDNVASSRIVDSELAVTMPLGKVAFGASVVARTYNDFGALSGTSNGTSLQVSYALSKRTAVLANYANWTQISRNGYSGAVANGVAPGTDRSNLVTMAVSHSF